MKTLLSTLLLVFLFSLYFPFVYSQDLEQEEDILKEFKYKPFDEFDNDTIAFLEYNFGEKMKNYYTGMTVKDVLEFISLPYLDINCNARMIIIYDGIRNQEEPTEDSIISGSCVSIKVTIATENKNNTSNNSQIKLPYIIMGLNPFISPTEYSIISGKTLKDKYACLKDWKVTYAIVDPMDMEYIKKLRERGIAEPFPFEKKMLEDTEETRMKLRQKNWRK